MFHPFLLVWRHHFKLKFIKLWWQHVDRLDFELKMSLVDLFGLSGLGLFSHFHIKHILFNSS